MSESLSPTEVIKALQEGKQVEVKFGEDYEWEYVLSNQMIIDELIDPEHQFRLPKKPIRLDDISFPKAESVPLVNDTKYFSPCLIDENAPFHYMWRNSPKDLMRLRNNLVHLTKENAIAHAKALIKLSGSGYEPPPKRKEPREIIKAMLESGWKGVPVLYMERGSECIGYAKKTYLTMTAIPFDPKTGKTIIDFVDGEVVLEGENE